MWNYDGNFLENFELPRRSLITNMFCNAVREGNKMPDDVIDWVTENANYRLYQDPYLPDRSVQISLERLLMELETSEAKKYAEFIIRRESLSFEQKAKLKREAGESYAKNYMAVQPPTEKQLSFLKSLGCEKIPETKLEASELISEYKTAKM